MIQRLQTVYLFIVAVINFLVYFTPIYSRAVHDPAGWTGDLFALLLLIAIVCSLYSIFLFRDRIRQLKWVKIAMGFQAATLAAGLAILLTLGGFGLFLMKEGLSVFILLLALIALWQAARLIRKDQELVESMDRIR